MAGGTLDIGVVMQGFGIANEQLGVLQNSLRGLSATHKEQTKILRTAGLAYEDYEDAVSNIQEANLD